MDRRVTPPTWGPLSPCKQALKVRIKYTSSALESPSINWPIVSLSRFAIHARSIRDANVDTIITLRRALASRGIR